MLKIMVYIILVVILVYLCGLGVIFYALTHLTSAKKTRQFYQAHYQKDFHAFIKDKTFRYLTLQSPLARAAIPFIQIEQEGARDWAILIHRLGGQKECTVQTMRFLYEQGFNLLAYDQRRSGQRRSGWNGLAVAESQDALAFIDYAKQISPAGSRLLLFGESYGGATAAIAAGQSQPGQLDYLLLDCPQSDLSYYVKKKLACLPHQLVQALLAGVSVGFSLCFGFGLKDARVSQWIKQGPPIATFIYHSDKDWITPAFMARDIYQAIPHPKKRLYTSQSTGHLGGMLYEQDQIRHIFEDFMDESSENKSLS